MKHWSPTGLYNIKPWIMMIGGALLCGTCVTLSVMRGEWDVLRGMGCGVGAGLVVAGGAIIQLRQTYRANSKWRRTSPR